MPQRNVTIIMTGKAGVVGPDGKDWMPNPDDPAKAKYSGDIYFCADLVQRGIAQAASESDADALKELGATGVVTFVPPKKAPPTPPEK